MILLFVPSLVVVVTFGQLELCVFRQNRIKLHCFASPHAVFCVAMHVPGFGDAFCCVALHTCIDHHCELDSLGRIGSHDLCSRLSLFSV